MKITMKEIARRAGVSPSTVSRVVNGNCAVAADKREKIMKIVTAEAGRKNWIGRRRRSRVRHIGFLLLSGSRFDVRTVGAKIIHIAEQLPGDCEFQVYASPVNAHRIEARFLHGELDGLLLSGHQVQDPFLAFLLNRIPHVWLNSFQLEDHQAVALMGNEFAGRIAANYLLERRCRRPAVLSFRSDNIGLADRIAGFSAACFLKRIPAREIPLALPGGTLRNDELLLRGELLEEAVRTALAALPAREFPDGIFSPEEVLTPCLYRVFLRERRKTYPLVISCNHTPGWLAGLYPRPASIDLHPETLVKLAIDELLNRIEGKPPRPDNIAAVVQPELVPGETP